MGWDNPIAVHRPNMGTHWSLTQRLPGTATIGLYSKRDPTDSCWVKD
jgi:hypothetical protein